MSAARPSASFQEALMSARRFECLERFQRGIHLVLMGSGLRCTLIDTQPDWKQSAPRSIAGRNGFRREHGSRPTVRRRGQHGTGSRRRRSSGSGSGSRRVAPRRWS